MKRGGAARKGTYIIGAGSLELNDEPRDLKHDGIGASEYISRSDVAEIFAQRSVETNIEGGPPACPAFWRITSEHEEAAKQPFILFSPDATPDWWAAARDRDDIPSELVNVVRAGVSSAGRSERINIKKARFPEMGTHINVTPALIAA